MPEVAPPENHESVWSRLPAVERIAPDRWRCETHAFAEALLIREGVYRIDGGETIAHAIRILADAYPDRRVVAFDVLFTREGRHELPTEYVLREFYAGRNFAFVSIEATQPGRGTQAHAQATLSAAAAGLSHQTHSGAAVDWAGAADDMGELLALPVQVAGGRALGDPGEGSTEVHIRVPLPPSLRDRADVAAYLAEVADHALTAPVFRPHAGVGYRTKRQFYTAPTGLQLRFWGDPAPGEVLTMSMTSPVMADGFGTAVGSAFDADGRLVFSCTMDVVVRAAD